MRARTLRRRVALPARLWSCCGLAAGILATVWLAAGCDSGSYPVSPSGSSLAVRAIPSTITATGSSTIEVLATQAGLPVRTGTEIRVTTTLGRIATGVITTDGDGLAFTTLVADGRLGSATVTASSGAATAATATVTIGTSLAANFTCSGNASELTVIFSDSSTGTPEAWSWDFGDGGASSAKDPVHTYTADGSYLVTLTVSNQGGSDSASKFVAVPGGTC